MPKVRVVHGRWGEVVVGGQVLAEVTGIEYTVEIERVDVPQVGARWNTFTEGILTGTGTLRMHKTYSRWETLFMDYVAKSPAELRAARDANQNLRPSVSILVALDDPHSYGRESETLLDVLFWSYTGGFALTDVLSREWPFTFEGITPGARIRPDVTIPTGSNPGA